MATTEPVTAAVVTSPSFVLVQDAAVFLPKFAIGVTVLAIGTLVFAALMVFLNAMLPGLRQRTYVALDSHPWQSLITGVLAAALLGSLAAFVIAQSSTEYLLRTEYNPVMLGTGILICVFIAITTFIGSIGLVQAIGEKLETLNGQKMSGLRKTFWGSLTLVGACLFPAIGWFLIVPASLLFAFGSTLRALLPGRKNNPS
jgi:hypothetical protein